MSLSPENNDNDQKKEKKFDWLGGLTERTTSLFFQTNNRLNGYCTKVSKNLSTTHNLSSLLIIL